VRMRDDEPRIVRAADGSFRLRLTRPERVLLRSLPGQLRELMDAEDPAVARLFPPAYRDDPDREAEYRRMVHDELVAGRRRALDVMEKTVDARRLDADQMAAWLGALNDLRLVLGTRLEVTEDSVEQDFPPGDPRRETLALYHYLGWLESQAVDALASAPGG
jgi:Domain of unknown function (DUF2017)